MSRGVRYAMRALLGTVVLLAALFLGLYAMHRPSGAVPATVTDDAGLPHIQVNGVRLHAQVFGPAEAPLVVVLHGGPGGDHRALLPLRALADEYRVVFYDQRGAGLSARVAPNALAMDALYAEVAAVIDHHDPGAAAHVVGHSWGAMLGIGFARRHPDRVRSLVAAEPGMLTDEAAAAFMAATNGMQPPTSFASLSMVTAAFFESLHVSAPDPHARSDYFMLRLMTSSVPGHPIAGYFCGDDPSRGHLPVWRQGAKASQAIFGSAMREDGSLDLDLLDAPPYPGPLLLVTGSCNRLIGTAFQREFHLPHLPNAELVEIEAAGHTMFGERPEESLRVLRGFLSRVNEQAPR